MRLKRVEKGSVDSTGLRQNVLAIPNRRGHTGLHYLIGGQTTWLQVDITVALFLSGFTTDRPTAP